MNLSCFEKLGLFGGGEIFFLLLIRILTSKGKYLFFLKEEVKVVEGMDRDIEKNRY